MKKVDLNRESSPKSDLFKRERIFSSFFSFGEGRWKLSFHSFPSRIFISTKGSFRSNKTEISFSLFPSWKKKRLRAETAGI